MGRLPPVLQTYSATRDRPFFDFVPTSARIFPVRGAGTFVPGSDWFEDQHRKGLNMLGWVVTFLIVALIAGILGFGGIAGASVEIAKIIFFIAVVLFLISAVFGLVRGRTRV
jgi:uncharacterized membrane protein YtjA (UPF0391 family)